MTAAQISTLLIAIPIRVLESLFALRVNAAAIRRLWSVALEKRQLLRELINRQLRAAHAGRGLGVFWQYFHPLFVVLVYLLIFGFVIGGRIGGTEDLPGSYPSYILAGLVPWLITQNAMMQATGALADNSNLVKQVIFPIELLPIASTAVSLLTYAPAFVLVLLHSLLLGTGPTPTLLALPLLLVLHFGLSLGLSFILSSVTVFIRDVRELISLFSVVAVYLLPIVYLPSWMPTILKPVIYLNPFSYLIWAYQDVLFFGEIRHPFAWAMLFLMALAVIALGVRTFAKLKPYYGNAL